MAESIQRETAKIYQFPQRQRAADRWNERSRDGRSVARYPRVDFGSGWYHEAAIESEEAAKR